MKNRRLRIVNKSKDGITIDFKGDIGIKKSTWEEFNKVYEICKDDNKYCILRPEWEERIKKAQEIVDESMVYYLQIDWKIVSGKTIDITQLSIVSSYAEKISELMECSLEEAMSFIVYRGNQFRKELSKPEKKSTRKREDSKESNDTAGLVSKNKISDFNPDLEKLRDQLRKEENE